MNLLTLTQAGKILQLPNKAVLRFLKEEKVPVYYFGVGRGKGYRVDENDLLLALMNKKIIIQNNEEVILNDD